MEGGASGNGACLISEGRGFENGRVLWVGVASGRGGVAAATGPMSELRGGAYVYRGVVSEPIGGASVIRGVASGIGRGLSA